MVQNLSCHVRFVLPYLLGPSAAGEDEAQHGAAGRQRRGPRQRTAAAARRSLQRRRLAHCSTTCTASRCGCAQQQMGTGRSSGRAAAHPGATRQQLDGRELAAWPLRQHHAAKGARSKRVYDGPVSHARLLGGLPLAAAARRCRLAAVVLHASPHRRGIPAQGGGRETPQAASGERNARPGKAACAVCGQQTSAAIVLRLPTDKTIT